jgi:hypothetical protein
MAAPAQAIPKDVLDSAECVAVFPQVIREARPQVKAYCH